MVRPAPLDEPRPSVPMAAMVDLVFLMLFYFLAWGQSEPELRGLNAIIAADVSGQAAVPTEARVLIQVLAGDSLILGEELIHLDAEGLWTFRERLMNATAEVDIRPTADATHGSVTRVIAEVERTGRRVILHI